MAQLKFKSLSVLDFIEESKSWDKDNFIPNVYTHKEELKRLDVENPESIYFGCGREIWHLIDFCRKFLWYNETQVYPNGMTNEDYEKMMKIFERYTN